MGFFVKFGTRLFGGVSGQGASVPGPGVGVDNWILEESTDAWQLEEDTSVWLLE